ncbi:flagella basal body P-ring formation protein FlgA [Silvanigrella aquatica]|uniref:Flagella basal body P-ring formation protein FlgA SAF domain-containing protein n=1 Tax=Silvanigrella aquatica TaxID=1915309 RepID=A0A1L4D2X7_9BACT|nr:flagella basal body P-ring formation protein FlgA [Silvanigrella aquatica]APJ04542.1 hypothetical protein AXG55_11750 [Silvanigrella aquatica]
MIMDQPLIYIEYKSLSNDESISEIQKDIIVQLIKINKPHDLIIIENLHEKEQNHKQYILSAKCIQCQVIDNSQLEIDSTSIKKSNNKFTDEYTFNVSSFSNKKTTWKIEIIEKKIIYYIAAKQYISPNNILSEKDLEVVSCMTSEPKCLPKFPFFSSNDALQQFSIYKNKKAATSFREGQEIEAKWLSDEILIRSGEKTKVTYSPNNSLTIQTFGKSLSNGGRGEIIRVQINDWFDKGATSRPIGIIEGTVVAPGEVEYAAK